MLPILWAVALSCSLLQVLADDEYCYTDEKFTYKYFGTKTAYETVRNHQIKISDVPNCEPVMMWGLFRHGTRYPHEDQITKLKNLSNLRNAILRNHDMSPHNGQLCFEDLQLLRDWNYTANASDADLLSSSGVNELYLLGKRLRTDFPFIDIPYSTDKFKIRFTEKIRTKQSADAFTRGLFGNAIDLPTSFVDETLLEPSSNCSSWKDSTRSEGLKKETEKFRKSPLMKSLIGDIRQRLGFDSDLGFTTIDEMYDMCRFDSAWNPNSKSPWCAVFTSDHLKVMEYDEDLEYYYRFGYGNPFTDRLGCPLVRDLMETINKRTLANSSDEAGPPSAVLYFTHSMTLRSVLVALGMAQDEHPITADSFTTSDKRQWRTSIISPFAGNLVVVLYKCGDDYKVIFYLNEQYVDYRGCEVGLCNWTYIYDEFSEKINPYRCTLGFCSATGSATLIFPSFTVLVITLSILITKAFCL